MSYDIFFVRRDPGQAFEDALDELEGTFDSGDPGMLSADELDRWDELVPQAREILGDIDVDDEDDASRQLVARSTGIELTLIPGEIEIHVPDDRKAGDDLELMSEVYELARAVEAATGLEGFDPQVGEPVSGTYDDLPTTRRWKDDVDVDDDDDDLEPPAPRATRDRPDMTPDSPATGTPSGRRWWEFWKS